MPAGLKMDFGWSRWEEFQCGSLPPARTSASDIDRTSHFHHVQRKS